MELLDYSVAERVALIRLQRPEKRNALNQQLVDELQKAFEKAESSPSVKVIVLTGSGTSFSAGADLSYLQSLQGFSSEENLKDSQKLMELFKKIHNCSKPVIAKVNGHAIAGGCGLITVCDFAFAVQEAKFSYSEVKIGFVPAIVSTFLVRKFGEGLARKLLLSGQIFDASTAKHYGLIDEVYDQEELSERVRGFAHNLAEYTSGTAVALTKKLINQIADLPLEEALKKASTVNAEARKTKDCKKGIAAFLNKEELKW